jgi:Global regulator protein family
MEAFTQTSENVTFGILGIFDRPFRYVSVHELIGFSEPRSQTQRGAPKGDTPCDCYHGASGNGFFSLALAPTVKILAVNGGTVRLSIEAPSEILIIREEPLARGDSKVRVEAGSSSPSCE